MDISKIEDKIASNELTPAQVFTLMKQHISTRTDIIDEAIETIKKCELVAPNVKRIRLYEALGALHSLKRGSR